MTPLTDDEAALLYTVQMWGSDSYPIQKQGRAWIWRDWRGVKGTPVVYRTKRAAVAAFQGWIELALERWRDMKAANPSAILTAVGIS